MYKFWIYCSYTSQFCYFKLNLFAGNRPVNFFKQMLVVSEYFVTVTTFNSFTEQEYSMKEKSYSFCMFDCWCECG